MRYFVVSDVHSFGHILSDTLSAGGFEIGNPEHKLIVCGDIFDRGPDTVFTYEYLKALPKDQLILVRGNHELLYMELLKKPLPERFDYSNGTVRTFCHIAGFNTDILDRAFIAEELLAAGNLNLTTLDKQYKANWRKVKQAVKKSEITKFIMSDRWQWYFETKDMVFVHSFVPFKVRPGYEFMLNDFGQPPIEFCDYDPDWRKADEGAWQTASWGCPWQQFRAGLFKEEGKTLVCGHWHTSDFFWQLDDIPIRQADSPIYNNHGLIGLDACTALSKRINLLIIDD